MKLRPVNVGPRPNRWCGPAIISIITGCTTREAADLLCDITGARQITGTFTSDVKEALRRHGYALVPVKSRNYGEKPTLAAWLRDTPRPAGVLYMVIAGHHYQAISGRRYCCGRVREIVSIRDKRVKRRARVTAAYVVERRRT